MYLTFDEYKDLNPDAELTKERFKGLVSRAESEIDSLTFNRISASGFETLTDFQKSLVRSSVAEQLNFIDDNFELLNSPLSAYSVSGVSMSFDSAKVLNIGAVITTNEVYGMLMQTGLCYRGLR